MYLTTPPEEVLEGDGEEIQFLQRRVGSESNRIWEKETGSDGEGWCSGQEEEQMMEDLRRGEMLFQKREEHEEKEEENTMIRLQNVR